MFTFKEQTGQKTQWNGDYAIYNITCTIRKSRVWGFVTSEQTVVSLILTDHSPRCHPWMGFGVLQHQPLIGVRRTIMLRRWSRNSVSLQLINSLKFIEVYSKLLTDCIYFVHYSIVCCYSPILQICGKVWIQFSENNWHRSCTDVHVGS